jgi:hypothetical protein
MLLLVVLCCNVCNSLWHQTCGVSYTRFSSVGFLRCKMRHTKGDDAEGIRDTKYNTEYGIRPEMV